MNEKVYSLISDLTRVRIVVKTLTDVTLLQGTPEEEELLKAALSTTCLIGVESSNHKISCGATKSFVRSMDARTHLPTGLC